MPTPETILKDEIKRAFKKVRADLYIPQDAQHRGVPDCIICLNGRSIRIELKASNKAPTPLQQRRLEAHAEAGGISGVYRKVDGTYKFESFGLAAASGYFPPDALVEYLDNITKE